MFNTCNETNFLLTRSEYVSDVNFNSSDHVITTTSREIPAFTAALMTSCFLFSQLFYNGGIESHPT